MFSLYAAVFVYLYLFSFFQYQIGKTKPRIETKEKTPQAQLQALHARDRLQSALHPQHSFSDQHQQLIYNKKNNQNINHTRPNHTIDPRS